MRSIFWRLYAADGDHRHPAELIQAFDGFGRRRRDPDLHRGAIEGDRPGDTQHWNRNASALNAQGLPSDCVAIAEDVIGANEDDSQGG